MEVRPRAQLAGRQPQLVLIVLLTRLVVPPSAWLYQLESSNFSRWRRGHTKCQRCAGRGDRQLPAGTQALGNVAPGWGRSSESPGHHPVGLSVSLDQRFACLCTCRSVSVDVQCDRHTCWSVPFFLQNWLCAGVSPLLPPDPHPLVISLSPTLFWFCLPSCSPSNWKACSQRGFTVLPAVPSTWTLFSQLSTWLGPSFWVRLLRCNLPQGSLLPDINLPSGNSPHHLCSTQISWSPKGKHCFYKLTF